MRGACSCSSNTTRARCRPGRSVCSPRRPRSTPTSPRCSSGDDLDALAAEAGRHGAATVFTVADAFASPLPGPRIDVLAELVRTRGLRHRPVLELGARGRRRRRARRPPRRRASTGTSSTSSCATANRSAASRCSRTPCVADVGWRSAQRVALFRPGSFEAVPSATGREPAIESLTVDVQRAHAPRRGSSSSSRRADEGPSLDDADVIVAGGIGLGAAEGFELAEQLAAVLGGAVGATRAAVYKGWYPPSAQIGQTGKTVSPKLYVALGISGAVQHKVGMQNSKTIVADQQGPATRRSSSSATSRSSATCTPSSPSSSSCSASTPG